jgi:crotonobetainyl-CoA:carnitine CoA-transferase CaiB-like acyl-CoA transferase
MGFLSPYRVLDLTDETGLLGGWMLARLGADVIQVEPPGGSPARRIGPFAGDAPEGERSLYWSAYAAGKRSVTCDLGDEEGRELFLRLLTHADVLLESAPPGALARLDLDHETLIDVNPALVHVSITPYGPEGPKSRYQHTDLTLWASAGTLWPSRDNHGTPLRISVPQAYLHGAADAAAGALIALFARHRSGRGQHVDVSAQQSASLATLATTLAAAVGHEHFQFPSETPQKKARQFDLSGSGSRTRRSKWQVRDGLLELHLGMGPAAGGSVNKLFAWMREHDALPAEFADWDWVTLPERIVNEEVTDEQIDRAREAVADFLRPFTKQELMDVAMRRGILMAPAMNIGDLVESPQLAEREFFQQVSEAGRPRTLPVKFAAGCDHGFAPAGPAPRLGEHNHEVFGELLGLSAPEIDRLARGGDVR